MNSLKRKQLTLRLPAELDKKLEKEAQKMGISKNAFAIMVLTDKFSRNQEDLIPTGTGD